MIPNEQREQERLEADHLWRGFTPPLSPAQCEGKPLPISPQPVKLSHVWWVGADTLVVDPCGKPTCRVCHPNFGPYEYGVAQ